MYLILRRFTQILYRCKGTGLPRIADYIRRMVAQYAPAMPILIHDFFGVEFYCYLREHMGGQIFFRGNYSGEQLKIVKALLPVDGVFIDIGANQGEFTIFAAQTADKGKVFSFEPIKNNLDRLYRNIEINCFNHVKVFPIALGDKKGEFPVYDVSIPYTDGTTNEGLHTLHSSQERHNPAGTVQVRLLDEMLATNELSRLDLIKNRY